MRLVTATEKYRAVNEGTMAKKEFVRQMRQEFPQYVSQFNGFKDSVSILKNKGLIFETKPTGTKIYDERPAANIDLTRLERGIFYELQAAGLKPPFDDRNVTTEEYLKACKKAKDNLIKNPNYYIDIVAGESTNIDKHDREVPVKRGELKKDLFNDLKKANLKEAKKMLKEGRLEDLAETLGITLEKLQSAVSSIREIEDEVVGEVEDEVGEVMGIDRKGNKIPESEPSNYTKAEGTPILKEVIASAIGAIHDKYGEIPGINMLIKEFIKTHYQDIMDGADPIEEFNEFVSVNYPGPSDMIGVDGLAEAEGDDHHYIKIPKAQFKKAESIIAKNIDGNKVKMDFVDNDGAGNAIIYFMFDDGDIASGEANVFTYDAVKDLEANDVEVADHSAEIDEGEVTSVDQVIDPADYGLIGIGYLKGFGRPHDLNLDQLETLGRKIVKQLYKGDFQAAYDKHAADLKKRHAEKSANVKENLDVLSDIMQVVGIETVEDALKAIERYEGDSGPVSKEDAEKLIADLRATDDDDYDKNITNLMIKAFNIKLKGVSEVKEASIEAAEFAPSPNSNVPDANAEEYDVATAFKKAGVDMSKPVMVIHTYGSAAYGGDDLKEMSAEAAIEMLEAERQDRSKQYTDDGMEVPDDHHGFEFENSSVLEEDMPEGHEYKLAYFQTGDADFAITQEKSGLSEKKGKDHDGDGDVDGDDYMAAKDKAIKKAKKNEQLKEAIKGIIKKSLNEDTINEAATQELATLADTYGGYKGMQVVLNDLQNIVTDIESYQAKTKEKLQNVFNKVGDVENEDGLKVGAFLAPAIESAFNKDSRMVGGSRLMKGVDIPKVKFMSKDMEAPQNEESPKQTVFAPVKRYF